MQDAKEEVRARLNIEDVIGQYVQLKRAGRNFKGLSPFSGEKTPSFVVSPDKHIWHDFSSGRGGDVFTFVMEVEGMDFRQALELLAQKAGVELAVYDNKGGQELAQKKKHLLRAHDLAAQYYQQSLIKNQHAVDYVFRERGLSKEIVQQFRIGYAPTSGDALVQFLSRKGYSMQDLSEAGLTNQYGGDMFRGRMMVPLMDSVGQVIGFTARILQDDPKAPKYLNTPQTLLYDKSRHVFGLSQAKEAIRKNDYAVIVEGNLDVISSHQVGITGVVATAGTAITEYHLRALRRLSGNVRLAFDGDKAGLAATERAIPIAQNADVELTIISLSGGAKDPDELIKQDIALWQKAIDASESLVDWVLKQYAGREDMTTAQGKSRYTTNALRTIRLLRNSVEQEHYVKLVAQTTGGNSVNLTEMLSEEDTQEGMAPALRPTVNNGPRETSYDEWSYQDNLLAVSLIDGATHDLFRGVEVETFIGDERRAVAKYLSEHGGKALKDTPLDLQKYDTYVKILLLRADARYADWNEQDRYFETARLLRQVATTHKKKQKDLLTEQLRDAETVGDDSKATEIRGLINNLIKEIQNGKR